jgi:hypothetical protein
VRLTFNFPPADDAQKDALEQIQFLLLNLEEINEELDGCNVPYQISTSVETPTQITILYFKFPLIVNSSLSLELKEFAPKERCSLKALELLIPQLREEHQKRIIDIIRLEVQRQFDTAHQLILSIKQWKQTSFLAGSCEQLVHYMEMTGKEKIVPGQSLIFDRTSPCLGLAYTSWIRIAFSVLNDWTRQIN